MSEKSTSKKLLSNRLDVERALNGQKTQVRRNERYAEPGETIEIGGHPFEIVNVYRQNLGDMTNEDVNAEGFQTLDEYKAHLKSLHSFTRILPILPWFKSMKVWVHEFRRID